MMLFVLQGPSGSGKTTQAAHLAREKQFEKIITATTRAPRMGEVHGKDYYFLDDDTYDEKLKKGDLLAPTSIHGARYGIPKADLLSVIRSKDRHALVILDDKGARELKAMGAFVIGLRLDESTRHARLLKRKDEGRFTREHFRITCDATVDASQSEDAVYHALSAAVEKALAENACDF
ncbi:hypothetical protein [Aedoeadaptatus pacaensis]|uniref:hypothetical protein n=1 Tax=Aedoeadaptatus pacaensis TaxID=1776390 RepID=UPI0009EDAAC2|nr:hypothetical protein [Peptoniphilus pacaensis]